MRLLIDENLSPRLALALSEAFPGSSQLRDVGLKGADDLTIWSFAAEHGYAILSKDLVIGNTSTSEILQLLLHHSTGIETFLHEAGTSLLTLRRV